MTAGVEASKASDVVVMAGQCILGLWITFRLRPFVEACELSKGN